MAKHLAVLDTSFWSGVVHVGVDAYLPLFFERPILVPSAVVQEVERRPDRVTTRLREDQQRFRLWLEDGRLVIQDPAARYPLFGRGEAACLGLALERANMAVLVNEAKAYVEAGRIGLRAIAVPEIVVRLVREGQIAPARGLTMLDVLGETTSPLIIRTAKLAIGEADPAR